MTYSMLKVPLNPNQPTNQPNPNQPTDLSTRLVSSPASTVCMGFYAY